MSQDCGGDYYSYRSGPCDNRPTNSVFYFATSVVALLILTTVVLSCVCCICLKRRRLIMMNRMQSGIAPPSRTNIGNATFVVPGPEYYHAQMEEGRLGLQSFPLVEGPEKQSSGVCVIMPGQEKPTFIAEPSSPIKSSSTKSLLRPETHETSSSFLFSSMKS